MKMTVVVTCGAAAAVAVMNLAGRLRLYKNLQSHSRMIYELHLLRADQSASSQRKERKIRRKTEKITGKAFLPLLRTWWRYSIKGLETMAKNGKCLNHKCAVTNLKGAIELPSNVQVAKYKHADFRTHCQGC